MSSLAKKSKNDPKVMKELDLMQKKIAAIRNVNNLIKPEKVSTQEESYVCTDENGEVVVAEFADSSSNGDPYEQVVEETIDFQYFLNSEQKIHERIDKLDRKLDQILELLGYSKESEDEYVETVDPNITDDQMIELCSVERLADEFTFPINDEETFDTFLEKIKDYNFRKNIIENNSHLFSAISFTTVSIAVRNIMKELVYIGIVVLYSVTGRGRNRKPKKKIDARALSHFIHETFVHLNVEDFTFLEVLKVLTNFIGRAPDVFNRPHQKKLKTK